MPEPALRRDGMDLSFLARGSRVRDAAFVTASTPTGAPTTSARSEAGLRSSFARWLHADKVARRMMSTADDGDAREIADDHLEPEIADRGGYRLRRRDLEFLRIS